MPKKDYFADALKSVVNPDTIDAFTPLGYVPHAKQVIFHDLSQQRIGAILFGGAASGGKSAALTMEAIHCAVNFPGMRIGCIRRTYGELEESFLAELSKRGHARVLGAKWNQTDKVLKFPNGSIINFTYAENELDASRLLGGEYQLFCVDEAGLMPPPVIQHIEERLRSGTRGLPVIGLRLGTNPGGLAHKYLRDRFITPTSYGKEVAVDEDDRTVAFVQSKYTDNPYVDKGYEKVLNAIPDVNRRAAMRDGDWDAMVGAFFSIWNRMRHVVPAFDPPPEWQRYCGVDYGFRDPFAVEWAAVDNDARVWVYREIYATEVDAPNQAKLILEAEQNANEANVVRVADPSMWGSRGTPMSIADIYGMEGCGIAQADNDRLNGWSRFFYYLAEAPACEYHRSLVTDDQPNGWETCPLIHFMDERCPNLIDAIPNLPRSKTKPDDAETRQVDDHGIDACLGASTSVLTPIGPKRISDIKVGDLVDTREGPRRVLASGMTNPCAQTVEVDIAGRHLIGTPNHPVWHDGGWVPLGDLSGATPAEDQPVYNLAVEDAEEYYANGILVHNCRYLLMMAGTSARPVIYNDTPSNAKKRAHEQEVASAYGVAEYDEPLVYGKFAGSLSLPN